MGTSARRPHTAHCEHAMSVAAGRSGTPVIECHSITATPVTSTSQFSTRRKICALRWVGGDTTLRSSAWWETTCAPGGGKQLPGPQRIAPRDATRTVRGAAAGAGLDPRNTPRDVVLRAGGPCSSTRQGGRDLRACTTRSPGAHCVSGLPCASGLPCVLPQRLCSCVCTQSRNQCWPARRRSRSGSGHQGIERGPYSARRRSSTGELMIPR